MSEQTRFATYAVRTRVLLVLHLAFASLLTSSSGCSFLHNLFQSDSLGDEAAGITYYVGGAGPIGKVGSFSVPEGLIDAGYNGKFEAFPWQSWTHVGDQIILKRNKEKGAQLADEIKAYRRRNQDGAINIIALSAGTGVAAFALEFLPENVEVNHVFFLGCSLSSRYDLTRALKRVTGKLYVLYSPRDRILKNVVWYTGTVDRSDSDEGIAGLEGFYLPSTVHRDTRIQYQKIRNVGYRRDFSVWGYSGGHTEATSSDFIKRYVAPVILGDDARLIGDGPEIRYSRPGSREDPVSTQPGEEQKPKLKGSDASSQPASSRGDPLLEKDNRLPDDHRRSRRRRR